MSWSFGLSLTDYLPLGSMSSDSQNNLTSLERERRPIDTSSYFAAMIRARAGVKVSAVRRLIFTGELRLCRSL